MSKQSSNSSLEPIGPKYHRLSIKLDYSSVDDCRQCRQTSMDLLCAVNDRRCNLHATAKNWRCMQRPRIDCACNSQRLTVQATAKYGQWRQQSRIVGRAVKRNDQIWINRKIPPGYPFLDIKRISALDGIRPSSFSSSWSLAITTQAFKPDILFKICLHLC